MPYMAEKSDLKHLRMEIKKVTKGYFAFVLHNHLPYVIDHGKWPHGMDWLNEAAAETYMRLVSAMKELVAEGYKPKLTIDISPVLCEQLADESFKKEFVEYLKMKVESASLDAQEFFKYNQENMLATAQEWEKFYKKIYEDFEAIDRDIIGQFRKLQDDGYLEIMTCGATHGYFPLLSRDESVQAQVKMAVKNYKKHFNRDPKGTWLPECAYRPRYDWTPPVPINGKTETYPRKGSDEFLSENGLDFFVVDSALLQGGKSIGVYFDRFDALKR
ncbi:MAG: hypothetical protein GY865_02805, partial [candidate division Zixibacteria bacterium]|nr:hypothetical protein [candidate division Zixibacteria bacterium]